MFDDKEKDRPGIEKVDIVLDELRKDRVKNEKIISIVSRVKGELNNKGKKKSRKDRFNTVLEERILKETSLRLAQEELIIH